MTISTTQKIIKIGSSHGVTLPAKELSKLGIKTGEEVDIIVRKKPTVASENDVVQTANAILRTYKNDFRNLARR